MKSCYIFLIIILVYSNAFCQSPVDRGVLNLAGGISFSTTSTEHSDDNTNFLNIRPQAYIFVMNNLAVGGDIQFMRYSQGDNATNVFGIGPGVKYFFSAGSLYPYLAGSFSYTVTSLKGEDNNEKGTDFSFGGGMDIFISKNVAVEPYLRYHIMSSKYGDYDSISSKMFEIGIGFAAFIY